MGRTAGRRAAPTGALALQTGHVDFRGDFADGVSLYEWTRTIADAVRNTTPSILLPGDDLTLRTLLQLALEPPRELAPMLAGRLGELIRISLGDASRCLDAIDKTRWYEHAVGAGIAVADGGIRDRRSASTLPPRLLRR